MVDMCQRTIARLQKGNISVHDIHKGDLRVIAMHLGIGELRKPDCVYLLDGIPVAFPGKRMTRANVALLRKRVAEVVLP